MHNLNKFLLDFLLENQLQQYAVLLSIGNVELTIIIVTFLVVFNGTILIKTKIEEYVKKVLNFIVREFFKEFKKFKKRGKGKKRKKKRK